jgi:membrane protein implicated in regulation of membrane protease activity
MDNRKIFRALEYLWLFTAGFAVIVTVYFLIKQDRDAALYFFFVFLIGAVMYLTRRYQRRKQEQRDAFHAQNKDKKEKSR